MLRGALLRAVRPLAASAARPLRQATGVSAAAAAARRQPGPARLGCASAGPLSPLLRLAARAQAPAQQSGAGPCAQTPGAVLLGAGPRNAASSTCGAARNAARVGRGARRVILACPASQYPRPALRADAAHVSGSLAGDAASVSSSCIMCIAVHARARTHTHTRPHALLMRAQVLGSCFFTDSAACALCKVQLARCTWLLSMTGCVRMALYALMLVRGRGIV